METRDSFVGRLMGVDYLRVNSTESSVSVPPALIVTDERGDVWSIGFRHDQHMQWEVLRNDRVTGEFAERIVHRVLDSRRVVSIWSDGRWKNWTGQSFL